MVCNIFISNSRFLKQNFEKKRKRKGINALQTMLFDLSK